MSSHDRIILPEKYYLDYFNYVLDFVEKHYSHVLDQPEYHFYESFRRLSEDAKCLYIRFSNRRGDFFRLKKVNYPEIKNIDAAKEELWINDFLRINESKDPIQFHLFTKEELIRSFHFLQKSQRKSDLLLELTEQDLNHIHTQEEIAEVRKNQEVEFLKLLFFGNKYAQMTEFVIRDVGNVKIQAVDESKFQPWFQSREEALGVMHLTQLKKMIREVISAGLPLEDFLQEMPWSHWLSYPRSKDSAEKLLLEVATHFEKQSKMEEALTYYDFISIPPANERKIRILQKLQRTDEAISIAQQVIQNPANASELTFATDYLNRSGLRISRSMTKRLKCSPSIVLSHQNERVEQEVLHYYHAEGWNGVHSENAIWRSTFGLVFWEELFNAESGAFHHPLQRHPSDLDNGAFFMMRKDKLMNQLQQLRTKKSLINHVLRVYSQNYGTANRFVNWHEKQPEILENMISRLPLSGLKKVMLEMAKRTKENSTGFPDLFLWNEEDYQFYEIKSPNDHLSAQQLFWLDFLVSVNIKADVLRVTYSA